MKVSFRALGAGIGSGHALVRRLPAFVLGLTVASAALWSGLHDTHQPAAGQRPQPAAVAATDLQGPSAATARASAPKGITPQAWARIIDDVRQRTYEVQPDASSTGNVLASNPAQKLQARFSAEGVELTPAYRRGRAASDDSPGSFRLQTLSVNDRVPVRSVPVASANRVDYQGDGYREWYINEASGMEQGWTLASARADGGKPVIRVAVDGVRAVAEGTDALRFDEPDGKTHYRYAGLAAWDAAHHRLPAQLQLDGNGDIEIAVNDRGARYPITVDPALTFTNSVTLADPASTSNDHFGNAIAVNGDTAVIGAYSASGNQGAVYIFSRNQNGTGAWGLAATLSDPAAASNDLFGGSVAVDGDTVIVGASGTSGSKGRAYIYGRDQGGAGTWGLALTVPDPAATANDQFGSSVAINGDTAVVGSTGKNKAYVFGRNQGGAGNWGGEAGLTASSTVSFGDAVAVQGDTIVVGAQGTSSGQGAAYVFLRNQGSAGAWGLAASLSDPSSNAAAFGSAVALDGDLVVVGAASEAAAYVFSRDHGGAGTWGLEASLFDPTQGSNDTFGMSVAADGDTVVVGASTANNSLGAVYTYNRNQGGPGNWGLTASLAESTGTSGDSFGEAVALNGNTLVVGATGVSSIAGASFIYDISGGFFASAGGHSAVDSDSLGQSVSISGDNIAVGAPGATNTQGVVYIYGRDQGGAGNWGIVTSIADPAANSGDAFGSAVAIDGDTLAVGACHNHRSQGIAYVFGRNQVNTTNGWGLAATLQDPAATVGDLYGCPIAVNGDTVVVGAAATTNNRGEAYVYGRNHGGTGSWGLTVSLTEPGAANNDQFGTALSVDGDTLAVGAPAPPSGQGKAYLYSRNQGGAGLWGLFATLADPAATSGDQFGVALGIYGDTLVVGASGATSAQGEAYIYERNQGGTNAWGLVTSLTDAAATPKPNDLFGGSVAVYGNTVVVGSPGITTNTGAAYAYDRNLNGAESWGQIVAFTNPQQQTTDEFGLSVAVDADTVVVGGPTTGINSHTGQAIIYSLKTGLPTISLNQSSLTYASQAIGTGSAQTVTVTNNGTGPLNVAVPTVTGTNAGDFTVGTNTCNNPLPGGSSCVISVTFSPTATGSRSATLTITSDAPTSGGTVSLSGTGTQSTVTLGGDSGAFGDQPVGATTPPQIYTLTNSGTATLNVGAPSLGGTNVADFAISANDCSAGIAIGASCSIGVTFTPKATGARSATLTLTSNASNSPTVVNLSGNGTQPTMSLSATSLNYGSQLVATAAAQTVTVSNAGTAPLNVSTPTLTGGNAGDFAISANTCTSPVAINSSCSIGVTFTPAATGSRSATLTIASDAPTSPAAVSLSGTGVQSAIALSTATLSFGSDAVGTATVLSVTVSNLGSAPLNVGTPSVSGTNAADFAISTNTCTTAVATGGSCSLSITFTPAGTGALTAFLTIPSDAPTSPSTVTLKGTGTQAAVQIGGSSGAFDSDAVGSTGPAQTFILTSIGTASLVVGTPTLSGSNPGDFTISANTCTAAVAINASCSISVTFTPSASGSRSATLNIPSNAATSPNTLSLTGTGTSSSGGGGAFPPVVVLLLGALAAMRRRREHGMASRGPR